MELKQLYTDLILEYNKDKTNKRKIENPTVHEHGHRNPPLPPFPRYDPRQGD